MIKVLIVDDDMLARKGLISIMPWSSHGMKVVGEAANGAKALEFLKNNNVDLMFVDLAMPVVSGLDLVQQTRILYPDLKFVIISFHEDFNFVQTSIRLGAIDYISKLQLEMEDYNEILERIERKMLDSYRNMNNESFHNSDLKNGTPEYLSPIIAINEKWAEMEKEWRTLVWLFDDLVFDKLCVQLLETGMPVHYVTALLTPAVAQVEKLTNIKALPEFNIDSIQSAINYIKNFRSFIYINAEKSDNLMETSICILKSVRLIEEKISEPLHTDTMANSVNMSRSYFCHCFKKFVGKTFNDYLRDKRIHMAKQLLKGTNQTISWICQACGYTDLKYFTSLFREQTDLLPSEYRKKYRNVGE